MNNIPLIQNIELTRYDIPVADVGKDLSWAMGAFYEPGTTGSRRLLGIRINTNSGVNGEYMSSAPGTFEQIQSFAPFLIGKNATNRELFYNQAKILLRKQDRMGIGPIELENYTKLQFINYSEDIEKNSLRMPVRIMLIGQKVD